ncbi:ASCH domain-containing protein [Vibrio fluvialis]|uniref:ASCH domain-containing protein n=1 Tax=Vibrio fluvialis TaxID=676 RepID=UPI00130242B9|nr:ASCH domain-containing protein [Vibrio fluvialis]MCE7606449.1 ASCH domain-containing protein [Vibrio fluvialis]
MTPDQQALLDEYFATLSSSQKEAIPQVSAEYFCADEYNANECARLINDDVKRASCSLKAGYDADSEPLPEVGRITVVLNWQQEPVCIIRLNKVEVMPFNQISAEFAALEGEGDDTYAWWRAAHIDFFTQYAQEVGVAFNEESDIVLEYFEKVFPLK